jgi:hypothetical protein
VQHLRQLPCEQLEFGDPLLDGAQLLRHEGMQAGTHGQTLPAIKLCRQRFERGEGEPEGAGTANEQEPMHIVAGVLPVSRATPAWHRQHADLLVITNGFCRDASGLRQLAHRQQSFHGCSSLYDVSVQKGTRSTRWKVKGKETKKSSNWRFSLHQQPRIPGIYSGFQASILPRLSICSD